MGTDTMSLLKYHMLISYEHFQMTAQVLLSVLEMFKGSTHWFDFGGLHTSLAFTRKLNPSILKPRYMFLGRVWKEK